MTIIPCFTALNPVPLQELQLIGEVPGFDRDPLHVPQTDYLLNSIF